MTINSPLISLNQVCKSFTKGKETIEIFRDLNLSIVSSEFTVIMGPSGSGKTTLLNLLGGIDYPTSGDIIFDGQKINLLSESKLSSWRAKNIGIIFQSYNLMPMLSALKNVELPLYLTSLNSKKRREKALNALELVGLSDRFKHTPNELSGGQQQRVAIARAIVANPKLLLCDEPTGDLDRSTADEILKILSLLNSDYGKTIIMVTHDAIAAQTAKKTLHLDKGVFMEQKKI